MSDCPHVLPLGAAAGVPGLVMVTVVTGHAAQLTTGPEKWSPILTPMYIDIYSSLEKRFLMTKHVGNPM